MVSFILLCTISVLLLLMSPGLRYTKGQEFNMGLIVENCFDKHHLLEEKLSRIQAQTNITKVSTPCGYLKIAHDKMCSLLSNGITFMVALAEDPVLGYYQVAFDTLATPIHADLENIGVRKMVRKLIIDITRAWGWQNLFIYEDDIFGDVVPRCTNKIAGNRPCHLAMVWTTKNSADDFLDQSLLHRNMSLIQKSKMYYVIILSDYDTKNIIKKANEKKMFTDDFGWIIVHPGIYNLMKSFSVLTYESNVFLVRLKSKNTIMRDITELRQTFKGECAATWQVVQPKRSEQICNVKTINQVSLSSLNKTDTDITKAVLDVLEVVPSTVEEPSLHSLADWTLAKGYKRKNSPKMPNFEGNTLKVATLNTPPFVFVEPIENSTNFKFSGFLIDVLKIMAEKLNFRYEIYNVHDQQYGQQVNDSYWSGVIGALHRGEADLALANLTPLSKRTKVVRFLRTSISIGGFQLYYKKPTIKDESKQLGLYFRPLQSISWFVAMSLLLFMALFLGFNCEIRIASTFKHLKNNGSQDDFRLRNFIFTVSQMAAQKSMSCEPNVTSSRIVFVAMWFFCYLLFVHYCANLTSYFTTSEASLPIKNLDDFLLQSEYKIGFKSGTSYLTIINEDNSTQDFRELREVLRKDPTSILETFEEGYERAASEKFIFAHDGSTLRWKASTSCDFVVVGPMYTKTAGSLATNLNSPYYKGLDWALNIMQENGIIKRYQNELWNKLSDCTNRNNQFHTTSLLMMTGPFLFLFGGLVIAVLILFTEKLCGLKNKLFRKNNLINNKPKLKRLKQSPESLKKNLPGIKLSVGFKRSSNVTRRLVRRSTTFLTYLN